LDLIMTLDSKTFLIFGGVGGIGQALAESLSEKGHRVFVTTRNPDEAQSKIRLPESQILKADALDADSIQSATAFAAQEGLHGLAYCVGSIDLKPIARVTPEDLMKCFQLNVIGAFVAAQAAASALQQHEGAIVLFSSVAAQRGFSNHATIGTAKAGLEGLARSLAAELAPKVRINVIAPSLTDTPLAKNLAQNPKIAQTIADLHPLPRLGDAREMAALAEFLLLENAKWITGQVIHVDGGRSAIERR